MAAVAPINTHMLSPLSFLKSDEGSEVGVAPLLDPQNQSQAIKQTDFCISTSNDKGRTRRETKTLSGNGHFSGYGTPTNSLPNHSPLIPTHCLSILCPSRLHPT